MHRKVPEEKRNKKRDKGYTGKSTRRILTYLEKVKEKPKIFCKMKL